MCTTWESKLISGKEFLTKFNSYHVINTFLHSWGVCGNKELFYKSWPSTLWTYIFVPSSPACEKYYISREGKEKHQNFCIRAVVNISECFLSCFVARSQWQAGWQHLASVKCRHFWYCQVPDLTANTVLCLWDGPRNLAWGSDDHDVKFSYQNQQNWILYVKLFWFYCCS